jgi:hypothetical protein
VTRREKAAKFYKDMADVNVTFNDGEVKTYRITASPSIGGYLAREAGAHGVLSLFNSERSWGIPTSSFRDWEIIPVPVEPEIEATDG